MNLEPFNSYKAKTYNPGSPAPHPLKKQFTSFPSLKTCCQNFTSFSPDPKNPLKVTCRTVRKRKSRVKDSEDKMSSVSVCRSVGGFSLEFFSKLTSLAGDFSRTNDIFFS